MAYRGVPFGPTINGNGVYGAKTVGTSAVLACVGSVNFIDRVVLTIFNNHATNTLYWGYNSSVTTSTGTPILSMTGLAFTAMANQNIYVIASGASTDVRITEA